MVAFFFQMLFISISVKMIIWLQCFMRNLSRGSKFSHLLYNGKHLPLLLKYIFTDRLTRYPPPQDFKDVPLLSSHLHCDVTLFFVSLYYSFCLSLLLKYFLVLSLNNLIIACLGWFSSYFLFIGLFRSLSLYFFIKLGKISAFFQVSFSVPFLSPFIAYMLLCFLSSPPFALFLFSVFET